MLSANQYFHIYNHAIGNENLFREEKNYNFFIKKYIKYIVPHTETYAYCLMPNHFHLLLKVNNDNRNISLKPQISGNNFISQQFSNFFNSYSKSYNKVYERKGALFVHNYKSKPILTEDQFIRTLLYIHLNPVKHKFTDDYLSWNWSSLQHHFSEKKPKWMNSEMIKEIFKDSNNYLNTHYERSKELILLNDE
jgi:putative transposase